MNTSNPFHDFAELYRLFDRCNRTELYQIARNAGHSVLPNMSKDYLIRVILQDEPPPPLNHEIDLWRRAIMRFIIEHRRVLETQITCPAKSFQEDACSGCVDAQVIHCLTSNGTENFKLIELHKKAL